MSKIIFQCTKLMGKTDIILQRWITNYRHYRIIIQFFYFTENFKIMLLKKVVFLPPHYGRQSTGTAETRSRFQTIISNTGRHKKMSRICQADLVILIDSTYTPGTSFTYIKFQSFQLFRKKLYLNNNQISL